MAKKTETVRLLLHSKDQKSKATWQTKLFGNCLLCTILQLIFFIFFFIVLIFIAFEVVHIEKDIKRKGKSSKDPLLNNTIPGSDLCKSVNAENMSLVALGYLTGIREKSTMEAQNQIYYLTDRYFTDQEACAIEAALRLFQDKSIFIIEIGNFTDKNHTTTNFITYLRQHYTNLNQIKSTAGKFFKGSPFQNYFNRIDDFSIFAAKVLLVWQFGGTVVDPDFLLLSRRLYDQNEGFCEVDRDLLFCPNQCSAFVYQVVKTILDLVGGNQGNYSQMQENVKDTVLRIVDKSVSDYCGDEQAIGIGCIGINRLKEQQICVDLYKDCQYLRVQEWKSRNPNWKTVVQKFCPKIITKLQSDSNDPYIT